MDRNRATTGNAKGQRSRRKPPVRRRPQLTLRIANGLAMLLSRKDYAEEFRPVYGEVAADFRKEQRRRVRRLSWGWVWLRLTAWWKLGGATLPYVMHKELIFLLIVRIYAVLTT
ncbi:hypothetical protein Pan44_53240 [Caulifigura coniformis]|uniref:Uncharacterized protein n=1 Tax=Caulifigura coniformis TaxID=2527983 RepID=A0A517SMC9_9PLAN|nr:hypothetical protein [Caulifigura coniformis]QDT57256.1 hypothetical protein Pan44_53240 [Caulifigura coniformis]